MDKSILVIGNTGSVALATALAEHGLGVIVAEEKNEAFEPEPLVFTIGRVDMPEIDIELIKAELDKRPFEKFRGKPSWNK